MKRLLQKLCILSAVLTVGFAGTQISVQAETDTGYEIDHYDVQLNAAENGVYTITETLDVHFLENRHGIYLNIPTEYSSYSWQTEEGTLIKDYRFPVGQIEVLSDQNYEINYYDSGVQIQLGDADYYADEYETYKVSYEVHTQDLELEGKQMLYWNLISTDWNSTIHSSSFTIEMPKEFDSSLLKFYTDGTEADTALKYTVFGNTISGSLSTDIVNGRGITILLELPEGYFDYSVSSTGAYVIGSVSAVLAIIVILLFMKFGRDDRVINTVEFKAPSELTSAGVGYIIDGTVDNRDVTSLILDWANKGYLNIHDEESELTMEKVKDLPSDAHPYEHKLFDAIFSKGDTRTSSSMSEDMYEPFMTAKSMVSVYYSKKPHRVYSSGSQGFQILAVALAGIPAAMMSAYCDYMYNFSEGEAVAMFILPMVLLIASGALLSYVQKSWNGSNISSRIVSLIIAAVLTFIAYAAAVYLALQSEAMPLWMIVLVLICSSVILVLGMFMESRTPFGISMLGKVRGLREFILTAEKDRLDMLVKEDPYIFYHILPYAYAFNLTKIWQEHFKNMEIPRPDWYYGSVYNPYLFYNRMYYHMNEMSHPVPPVTAKSGGGGGFSGGGFGGGGGFSGGGFGGSSGGSW